MERQNASARARESELTDRILSMKGYREFGPVAPIALEPIKSEETLEWEEQSLLAEEGFRPL